MKKLITILLIIAALFSISVTAFAANDSPDEQFSNIADLVQYWEEIGYPDYVGNVYSTDGSTENITILLVNDDGTAESQIRSMLVDASGVSFGEAQYSYNSLLAINNEIVQKYMIDEQKVNSVSVGWTSIDGKVTGFGKNGKEARVVITVEENVLAEFTDEFKQLYGELVIVESGGAIILDEKISSPVDNTWQWILVLSIVLLIGASILYFNRTRLLPAYQTISGTTVTQSTSASKKETIDAIKKNVSSPSDAVYSSIISKITQKEA